MVVATVSPLPLGSRVPRARPPSREVGSRAPRGDVEAKPRRGPSTRGGLLVARAAPPRGDDPASVFDDPFFAAPRGVPKASSLFGDDADAVFGRAFREMDASVDAFQRRVEESAARAEREASRSASGAPRGYRRTGTFSQELPGGGTSRGYYSESVVTFGGEGLALPNVTTGALLGGVGLWVAVLAGVLVGAYVKLARRFAANFHRTVYGLHERLRLAAFWPVLWLADARGFRDQFAAAVRGGDADGNDARGRVSPRDGGGAGGGGDASGGSETDPGAGAETIDRPRSAGGE